MPQTIRLTITPDLEKALRILRQSTLGTLNTTELIKMAVGGFASAKTPQAQEIKEDEETKEMNMIAARQVYNWAKEDGTLDVDNISPNAKLRPYKPKPYVSSKK